MTGVKEKVHIYCMSFPQRSEQEGPQFHWATYVECLLQGDESRGPDEPMEVRLPLLQSALAEGPMSQTGLPMNGPRAASQGESAWQDRQRPPPVFPVVFLALA